MKKIFVAVLAALLVVMLAACASAEPVNVYALKGPTGIGMVGVMRDHADEYSFTLCGAPDEIVAAIASGSADIAAAPTNLAATLYKKTNGGVQLLALNTLGVLHILEAGESIQSVEDLAGRTLYATVTHFLKGGTQGGSTITQQLIKNITGDNEVSLTRKVKEIFRALNLEKEYSMF